MNTPKIIISINMKKVFLLAAMVCAIGMMTACGTKNDGGHHIKFKLDEYDFIDKTLKENLETVIAEQFKEEPDVPLYLDFLEPCGLLATCSTLDYILDSVIGTYDIEVETHHYSYNGHYEDSLQYHVEGCCMLAGHLCYISPDSSYFKKTGKKQKVSFVTYEEVCPCSENKIYLKFDNKSEIQLIPSDELLQQLGTLGAVTDWSESYDSLYNDYMLKQK